MKSTRKYSTGYMPHSPFNKFNYPERDRIQSMLSESVFVIQSENNGGTMICVKRSLKDKKTVCALKGNNLNLIKIYIDYAGCSLLFK